ncbi:MAG: hypothetical protein KDK61_08475, partial [Simkania sp.]|nr:hypothetical protein [Simkania sp.]
MQQKEKEPETSFVPQAKIISSEQEFIAAQKEVQQQATKKETAQAPAKEVDHKESQQHLSTITPLDKAEFHSQILRYFKDADIILLSQEQIAKNREYEFVVKVPSALGHMEMYCRAKNKKKLNEGDVAPALLKAKTKDLPCIFLSNGDFTKKSLAIIEKEYKGL